MKKRKFADGGETTLDAKPEGGRFSEDTYERAKRFVESGGKKEETKAAVKKARKVEVDPTAGEAKDKAAQAAADRMDGSTPAKRTDYEAGPGEIPRPRAGTFKAPASTGEDTSGPSNIGRVLSAAGAGAGVLGTAAALRTAGHANRVANRVAKAINSAEAVDKAAAPMVQAAKGKASNLRFDRMRLKPANKAEETTGLKKGGTVKKYASGGAVSSRADGVAQRGKTNCKMY